MASLCADGYFQFAKFRRLIVGAPIASLLPTINHHRRRHHRCQDHNNHFSIAIFVFFFAIFVCVCCSIRRFNVSLLSASLPLDDPIADIVLTGLL